MNPEIATALAFPTAILEEAIEFNAVNQQGLDRDEDLIALEEQLAEAIGNMDIEQARRLAVWTRGYIVESGYADRDELPTLR